MPPTPPDPTPICNPHPEPLPMQVLETNHWNLTLGDHHWLSRVDEPPMVCYFYYFLLFCSTYYFNKKGLKVLFFTSVKSHSFHCVSSYGCMANKQTHERTYQKKKRTTLESRQLLFFFSNPKWISSVVGSLVLLVCVCGIRRTELTWIFCNFYENYTPYYCFRWLESVSLCVW